MTLCELPRSLMSSLMVLDCMFGMAGMYRVERYILDRLTCRLTMWTTNSLLKESNPCYIVLVEEQLTINGKQWILV